MKSLAALILALPGFFQLSAQKTKSDVFNSTDIVWYGLDFSEVKLVGSEGFTNPPEIKNRYFNSWNQLFVTERDKYNLQETFKKKNVEYNLDVVEERNKLPNVEELVINTSYTLDEAKIPDMLKEYSTKETEGIGLVFIMEAFNKTAEAATMFVVFFDITAKTPLLVKKMGAKPGGMGIRNYWAGAVFAVLEKSKKEYPKWMKG